MKISKCPKKKTFWILYIIIIIIISLLIKYVVNVEFCNHEKKYVKVLVYPYILKFPQSIVAIFTIYSYKSVCKCMLEFCCVYFVFTIVLEYMCTCESTQLEPKLCVGYFSFGHVKLNQNISVEKVLSEQKICIEI